MTFVAGKCTGCGAALPLGDDDDKVICEYCDTLNYRRANEVIHRHIDEAKMRELDMRERERRDALRQQELVRAEVERLRAEEAARIDEYKKTRKRMRTRWTIAVAALMGVGILGSGTSLVVLIIAGFVVWGIGRGKLKKLDRAAGQYPWKK